MATLHQYMRIAHQAQVHVALILMALLMACSAGMAAPSIPAAVQGASDLERLNIQYESAGYEAEIARLHSLAEQQKLGLELKRAQVTQMIEEDRHARFVLWAQAMFSIVLTIFVLLVVAAGIYLSYLQFKATMSAGGAGQVEQAGQAGQDGAVVQSAQPSPQGLASKISFSTQAGFELSSSVIGLFVLLASMFFFHLYISEVYAIRRIDGPSPVVTSVSSAPSAPAVSTQAPTETTPPPTS